MSDCFDHEMDAFEDPGDSDYRGGYCGGLGVELPMKAEISSTASALLVELGEGFDVTRKWIPRSQIRHLGEDSITISNWLANKLGL